jgi:hypothetical protein
MWLASSLECRQAKMIVSSGRFLRNSGDDRHISRADSAQNRRDCIIEQSCRGRAEFSPYPTPELKAPLKALTLSENAQIPSAKSVE